MSLKDIEDFMKENNILNDTDINKVMKLLDIIKMDKDEDINNKFKYEIVMKGPKNSLYENGIFNIIIDFQNKDPKGKPEIKILQKIYHLNISPKNGKFSGEFINKWDPKFKIIHVLIGIYLILKLEQNPNSPYDRGMALEYQCNRKEFERKARLWTLQYATGKIQQNQIKILVEIQNENEKISFLSEENNEINKDNTELFIDKKKLNFQKNYEFKKGKHEILLKFTTKLKNCNGMFKNCTNLISIDLDSFDSSDVENMEEMFCGCRNLISINLDLLNTKKLTNMKKMFCCCESLKKLNISSFETNNVTDMSSMFLNCYNLNEIYFLTLNTNNLQNMSQMFKGCHNLKNLDNLLVFNTEQVYNMDEIFCDCYNLKDLNLASFKGENLISLRGMFYNCINLKSIILGNLIGEKAIDISYLFYECNSLISLTDISIWDTIGITNMSYIFSGCSSLYSLPDISKWNVKNVNDISGFFNECYSLKSIPDISKWNLKNVKNISHLFFGCSSLDSLPDISKWDTNSINNMSHLFSKCSSLISLPNISYFVTNKVNNMSYMFYSCSSLKFIPDISKWDTTNVKDLSHMFHGCSSITSLPDISEWNTCNNRDLSYMFHGCSSLKSLPNISNWNIKNVISFKNLISDCHSLSDLSTLKNWNLNIDTEINKGDGLELKYELKDDNLKFLPQLEIKFNNVNIIEKDIISKIKLEIQKLIEKKNFSIIEIRKGSLTALITLQFIIQDEIRKEISAGGKDLSKDFSANVNKNIERISLKIKEHKFLCLGSSKPDYAENNMINICDEKNRKSLKKKILKIPDNDDINLYEASRDISLDDINDYYSNLALSADEIEKNQAKVIRKLDEYSKVFNDEIEKALNNSIFEYKIIHLFVIDKDDKEYQEEKEKCKNKVIKVLFHGTSINAVTGILSSQFRDANMHIFGQGVYFTDQFDYAWYYAGENYRGQFFSIPEVGKPFSIVASEIYYDNSQLEEYYPVEHNKEKADRKVPKNGIRRAYVNYNSKLMTKEELNDYKGFIGNEFLITDKSQIIPIYGITLKRIEYLVVWRDYNFNENNPNSYENEFFNKMQNFHREIKKIILNELNSKVYYVNNTEDALNLIKKKKYNKIIIITNGSNDANIFIDDARKIIGADIIVGISVLNISKHYQWAQKKTNILLLNGIYYHQKFLKYCINNDLNGLNELRKEINNACKILPDFEIKKLGKDALKFPRFSKTGLYKDLNLVDIVDIYDTKKCSLF